MDTIIAKNNDDSISPRTSFSNNISFFIGNIESLEGAFPLLMFNVANVTEKANYKFTKFIIDNKMNIEPQDNKESDKLSDEQDSSLIIKDMGKIKELIRLGKDLMVSVNLTKAIPSSLLTSLVSQYDAFLGRLIKLVFISRPEILDASDRKMTLAEISAYNSVEEVRNHIIEKIVEDVLRKSHAEQIKWLESTIGCTLTKDLPCWPSFIEITERRNLIVHNDSIISSQYLRVCSSYDYKIEQSNYKVGDMIHINDIYFKDACDCIIEMAAKLTHVIWRKLNPNEKDKADNNLIEITYEIIKNENYNLADALLDFALNTLKSHSSENRKLILLVNRAQTLKWLNKEEEMRKLVDIIDWSALNYKFKLSYYVLIDDYDKAASMMNKIDDISKNEYHEWPLFKNFRETNVFKLAYKEKFGEEYTPMIISTSSVKDALEEIKKISSSNKNYLKI